MIKVTRLAKPSILEEKGEEWTLELCNERHRYYQRLNSFNMGKTKKKPEYPRARKTRYSHAKIDKQLKAMFGSKCAYCESSVTAVSYQHVEHFRPQSIYPRLAYDWNNLLLACERCNSGHKSDKFPLLDGSQPVEDEVSPCSLDDSDSNSIINPCIDDPSDFFTFNDEYIVCLNARAVCTKDVCGLNRSDLKDDRRFILGLIETIAKSFQVAKKDGRKNEMFRFALALQKAINVTAPFSAMTCAKLKALNIDIEEIMGYK